MNLGTGAVQHAVGAGQDGSHPRAGLDAGVPAGAGYLLKCAV